MFKEVLLRLLFIKYHPRVLDIGLFWANVFCMLWNLLSKDISGILLLLSVVAIMFLIDNVYKQIVVENNENQGETNVKSKNH